MKHYGSPWDHIIPFRLMQVPQISSLYIGHRGQWRSSRPTYAEQSTSYRSAMRDAGRGHLLP